MECHGVQPKNTKLGEEEIGSNPFDRDMQSVHRSKTRIIQSTIICKSSLMARMTEGVALHSTTSDIAGVDFCCKDFNLVIEILPNKRT